MASTASRKRAPAPARKFGYLVAIAVNVAIWYILNVAPGWEWFSFLTADTAQVIGWVNLSLAASVLVNLVYLVRDPLWLRSAGDLLTTAVSLVVTVRVWQVFPFDFSDWWFNATGLVRVLLVIGIVGSAIGIVAYSVTLARRLSERATRPPVSAGRR